MILLAAAALAVPPPRPEPIPVVAGECAATIRVGIGYVGGEPAPCSGYLVPDSVIADLLADRVWAEHLDAAYRADAASWAAAVTAADARTAAARPAWYDRPGIARAEGALGVGLVVVAAAVVAVELR